MLKVLFTLIYFTVVVNCVGDIDCNDGGFYIRADPKSTKHFYKCDNGKPVRFKCPDGLIYNRELHVCDWPHIVDKSATGTSGVKPSSNAGQQYSGNNGKPATTVSDKKKKPSNNEYTGNNEKPSNSAQHHNNKPSKSGQTGSSGSSGAGLETPWHLQSYSNDEADIYAVQIIDNNLDLGGLGYKDSLNIDKRKA